MKKIYIFSIFPWKNDLLHREHMLAMAFSRLGYKVCFVERCNRKIGRIRRRNEGEIEVITVFALPYMKGVSSLIFSTNDQIIRRQLGDILNKEKDVWLFVSSPLWAKIVLRLKQDGQIVIYDMSDNHLAFVTNVLWRNNLKKYEDYLLDKADWTFVSSENLLTKIPDHKKTKVFGNGVDLENFSKAKPILKSKYEGKIVGFIGGIYKRIDLGTIKACAVKLPKVNFVLIGPTDRAKEVQEICSLPNVSYLGSKPWQEIQDYFASLDVGIIPFISESEYPWLKTVDSVKVYQYAFFGYPILVTPFGRVNELNNLVRIAKNREDFVEMLSETISKDEDKVTRDKRKALAIRHDWTSIAEEMVKTLS